MEKISISSILGDSQELENILNAVETELHPKIERIGHSYIMTLDAPITTLSYTNDENPDEAKFSDYLSIIHRIFVGDPHNEIAPLVPNLKVEFVSHDGLTELKECYCVTLSEGTRLFIMPQSEMAKIPIEGIRLKNDTLRETLVQCHRSANDTKQVTARDTLLGERYNFIVPVLSGLKPLAFDIHASDEDLDLIFELNREHPELINYDSSIINMLIEKHPDNYPGQYPNPVHCLFNTNAIRSVVAKNKEIFDRIDVAIDGAILEIIKKVITPYFDPTIKMSDDDHIRLGLLLGYDPTSAYMHPKLRGGKTNFNNFMFSKSVHPFSNKPMNIWGVNYDAADENGNTAYKDLKHQYDALLAHFESQAKNGLSPYEVLCTAIHFQQQHRSDEEVGTHTNSLRANIFDSLK